MAKLISKKDYIRELLKDHKKQVKLENAIHVKEENEKKEKDEEKGKMYESMLERQAMPAKYNKFITSVKEEFLGDCIYSVFNESLNFFDKNNQKQEAVKRGLIKNFIQEQDVNSLLRRFRSQNALLSEFALIVDKAVSEVTESVDSYNINSWTVDSDIKDRFTDNLQNCNSKEAIIMITDRVSDAETDFVNDNMRKKMEVDRILQDKKEKLDSIEEKPEEVKESVAATYDRKIKAVKNKHITSIYQTIAESMTKNAITDPELRSIYVHEGTLDMDTLLEDTGIMYAFLETVYTTEMVDNNYISEFIKNI